MRLTEPRLAIFRALEATRAHPTADELYREARRDCPGVSLATVYNTLQALTEMGEIQPLAGDQRRRRYDPDTSQHQHARCRRCQALFDVRVDVGDLRQVDLSTHDFAVEGVRVEFSGLCGRCAREEAALAAERPGGNGTESPSPPSRG